MVKTPTNYNPHLSTVANIAKKTKSKKLNDTVCDIRQLSMGQRSKPCAAIPAGDIWGKHRNFNTTFWSIRVFQSLSILEFVSKNLKTRPFSPMCVSAITPASDSQPLPQNGHLGIATKNPNNDLRTFRIAIPEKAKSHPDGWPKCKIRLAPRPGLEPGTCGLTVQKSTGHS